MHDTGARRGYMLQRRNQLASSQAVAQLPALQKGLSEWLKEYGTKFGMLLELGEVNLDSGTRTEASGRSPLPYNPDPTLTRLPSAEAAEGGAHQNHQQTTQPKSLKIFLLCC
jgi:hypothetical protein